MAASVRSLSAVAFAFVAGVAGTSAYLSRGAAVRDAAGAPHEAAPSLSERLRAEAHGQSLPWSDPVKAAGSPAPPKLHFTPDPPDAPAKNAQSVARGETSPPRARRAPVPVRSPDEGSGRPASVAEAVRSASRDAPRRAPIAEDGHPRARVAIAAGPTAKPQAAPARNLPALDAVNAARLAGRQPEPGRARAPVSGPYKPVRMADRDDFGIDAPPLRRTREIDAEAPGRSFADQPRERPRRSVAASDGLMRWLSGPGGRF